MAFSLNWAVRLLGRAEPRRPQPDSGARTYRHIAMTSSLRSFLRVWRSARKEVTILLSAEPANWASGVHVDNSVERATHDARSHEAHDTSGYQSSASSWMFGLIVNTVPEFHFARSGREHNFCTSAWSSQQVQRGHLGIFSSTPVPRLPPTQDAGSASPAGAGQCTSLLLSRAAGDVNFWPRRKETVDDK